MPPVRLLWTANLHYCPDNNPEKSATWSGSYTHPDSVSAPMGSTDNTILGSNDSSHLDNCSYLRKLTNYNSLLYMQETQ